MNAGVRLRSGNGRNRQGRPGPAEMDRREGFDDQERRLRAARRGGARGAGRVPAGAVLRPVLLPGAGPAVVRWTEEVPDGPTVRADAGRRARAPHGPHRPGLRAGAGGRLLQHRRGHRRRRHATSASTARTTSRRSPGSGRSSTSGPATSATRCSTPPWAGSASTSATSGTSRRAGGRSAWPARRSCSTRRRPAAGCRSTCGSWSSPRPPWPTSTSSAPSTASASSRWATTTSTGSPTSPTRAGRSSAARRPTARRRSWSATWTWTCWKRSGTSGSSTATGAPTPTARLVEP